MPNFKAKNPNSISAAALPQTPLGELMRSQDLLAEFKGHTSKGGKRVGNERMRGGEGRER